MGRPASAGNRLLTALPPADIALLAPHIQNVSLEQDAVVIRAGDRRHHVYFPHSGAISFMLGLPSGETIATAVIGREGAIGALSVLGPSYLSSVTAVVRVGGTASQISVSRFHAAYMESGAIKHVVEAHTRSILMQFQHVSGCNGLHSVEARMARWLLHLHDRTEDNNILPLTQETLSQLLGVRRTTVTQVIAKLRALGAIRSVRRGLVEIDRARLEEATCECYDIIRGATDRIVPHEVVGSHPHFDGRQTPRCMIVSTCHNRLLTAASTLKKSQGPDPTRSACRRSDSEVSPACCLARPHERTSSGSRKVRLVPLRNIGFVKTCASL
jgi:CRP-like cAMP-binding protein